MTIILADETGASIFGFINVVCPDDVQFVQHHVTIRDLNFLADSPKAMSVNDRVTVLRRFNRTEEFIDGNRVFRLVSE